MDAECKLRTAPPSPRLFAGTQVTETTLAERYRDRAACLEAGKTLEYVDARNAPDIRVGYVCIATGRFK